MKAGIRIAAAAKNPRNQLNDVDMADIDVLTEPMSKNRSIQLCRVAGKLLVYLKHRLMQMHWIRRCHVRICDFVSVARRGYSAISWLTHLQANSI